MSKTMIHLELEFSGALLPVELNEQGQRSWHSYRGG